jgi:hypothetical protein
MSSTINVDFKIQLLICQKFNSNFKVTLILEGCKKDMKKTFNTTH